MTFVCTPRALERACVEQRGCVFSSSRLVFLPSPRRLASSSTVENAPRETFAARARLTIRRPRPPGSPRPELNEVLYLHHRGIVRLEHFDPYVNLRCLPRTQRRVHVGGFRNASFVDAVTRRRQRAFKFTRRRAFGQSRASRRLGQRHRYVRTRARTRKITFTHTRSK